ncbi:hypothetical protein Q7A_03210 [Methylophaga nitratireducenticrescens]|nr:hypothetical protein Q7A_03210 [Methylophaga nitratireducenticrescens]AUZ83458.1 hypothetical protein CDW43_02205 [Methylophaga nitratireducenticrescens]
MVLWRPPQPFCDGPNLPAAPRGSIYSRDPASSGDLYKLFANSGILKISPAWVQVIELRRKPKPQRPQLIYSDPLINYQTAELSEVKSAVPVRVRPRHH